MNTSSIGLEESQLNDTSVQTEVDAQALPEMETIISFSEKWMGVPTTKTSNNIDPLNGEETENHLLREKLNESESLA